MTLVLSAQIESRLVREARRKGISPEAYAEILLQRLLPESDEASPEIATNESEKRPRFGSARGMVVIADDFNEPLEDFQEYMD